VPRIWPHALAEHLRHARQVGFTDYFAELQPNWGLDGPMPWLAAQLTLDPFQSVDALLAEYYARYFREAAEPMRAFFELCERQWMTQPGPAYWLKHWRNDSQAALYPPEVCAQLRSHLDAALALSVTSRTRERVCLVRDTFAFSERFILRTEACHALASLALMHAPNERIESALIDYRAAHRELMRFAAELVRRQPQALHPFDWRDFALSDPEPLARAALQPARRDEGRELLVDPGMVQPVLPAREVAGLPYGVALPAAWHSRVEPVERHRAGLRTEAGERILRIAGTRNTSVQQWTQLGGPGSHRARVTLRGHVSPGNRVALLLGWLDAKDGHLGAQRVQLPAGEWPDWVTLEQARVPPPTAAWVGISLRVEYQVPGDWLEVKEFGLRAK
jgi:hypothetical protein